MRSLTRWARGRQWRIPFLAVMGLIAVIGSLLLYPTALVDKGSVGLVLLDLLLFFGGGALVTWGTIAWQAERREVYRRRAADVRRGRGAGKTRSKR